MVSEYQFLYTLYCLISKYTTHSHESAKCKEICRLFRCIESHSRSPFAAFHFFFVCFCSFVFACLFVLILYGIFFLFLFWIIPWIFIFCIQQHDSSLLYVRIFCIQQHDSSLLYVRIGTLLTCGKHWHCLNTVLLQSACTYVKKWTVM